MLPLPHISQSSGREVMVISLPPCTVSLNVGAAVGDYIETILTFKGRGEGSAVKHDFSGHDLTSLILVERRSAVSGAVQGRDIVLGLQAVTGFRVDINVSAVSLSEVVLDLKVLGAPQTYDSFILQAMKK